MEPETPSTAASAGDRQTRTLEPNERAEFAFKLASQAWDRFKNRREIEWKTTIGIWTLFGGSAAAVVIASTWQPTWFAFIGGIALTGSIVSIYRLMWLPYIAETHRRDQLTNYFWESAIQKEIGDSVPPWLEPNHFSKDDLWGMAKFGLPSSAMPAEDKVLPDSLFRRLFLHATFRKTTKKLLERFRMLHPVGAGQFWVTLLFALAFLTVWCDRFIATHHFGPGLNAPSVYEIHSDGKLDMTLPAKP